MNSDPAVEAKAKWVLSLPYDRRGLALAALGEPERKQVSACIAKLGARTHVQTALIPPQTVTHAQLWQRAWRDLKLAALDWRFYQHQSWRVQAGDLYSLTRNDCELYKVLNVEGGLTFTMVVNNSNELCEMQEQTADTAEFLHGGFAECRVHVPHWAWRDMAERLQLTLSQD